MVNLRAYNCFLLTNSVESELDLVSSVLFSPPSICTSNKNWPFSFGPPPNHPCFACWMFDILLHHRFALDRCDENVYQRLHLVQLCLIIQNNELQSAKQCTEAQAGMSTVTGVQQSQQRFTLQDVILLFVENILFKGALLQMSAELLHHDAVIYKQTEALLISSRNETAQSKTQHK